MTMEALINQWEQKLYYYKSIYQALEVNSDMQYWKGKISALEIAIEELRNATCPTPANAPQPPPDDPKSHSPR